MASSIRIIRRKNKAQSSMEYLMTYGWAILILAIVVGVLFALGLFNGSAATPNGCSPQPGFTCSNPVYTPNGITATISQDSGQNYYDAWVFVASEGENIGPGGLPVNFSESNTVNMTPIGTIPPSGTVTFNFNHTAAGGIPTANIPVGTEFTGYIWIAYCLSPVCSDPTNFAKVGSISAKETGVSTFASGGPTTTSSTTTSSSTTSTSTTSVYYVQITLSPSSSISGTFQQNITINPSSYSGQCSGLLGSSCVNSDLGNIRFYSSMSGNVPSGPLDSWLEGCHETSCSLSSTQALFWVTLPGGESAPNTVIYMVFNSLSTEFDGSVAGEAPQLSHSYAQYDNGANVFSFYDNFKCCSLNSSWTISGVPVTVDNGFSATAATSQPSYVVDTGYNVGSNTVIDFYGQAYQSSGWVDAGIGTAYSGTYVPHLAISGGGSSYPGGECSPSGVVGSNRNSGVACTSNAFATGPTTAVWSIYAQPSQATYYENYGDPQIVTAEMPSYPLNPALILSNAGNTAYPYSNTETMQWYRIRVAPPGGTMPHYFFQSLS